MAEVDTEQKSRRSRKPKAPRQQRQQQANPLVRYIRETRGELRKVTWPTAEETWRLTLIVLAVSVATAIFLGGILDPIFSSAVRLILEGTIGV